MKTKIIQKHKPSDFKTSQYCFILQDNYKGWNETVFLVCPDYYGNPPANAYTVAVFKVKPKAHAVFIENASPAIAKTIEYNFN